MILGVKILLHFFLIKNWDSTIFVMTIIRNITIVIFHCKMQQCKCKITMLKCIALISSLSNVKSSSFYIVRKSQLLFCWQNYKFVKMFGTCCMFPNTHYKQAKLQQDAEMSLCGAAFPVIRSEILKTPVSLIACKRTVLQRIYSLHLITAFAI